MAVDHDAASREREVIEVSSLPADADDDEQSVIVKVDIEVSKTFQDHLNRVLAQRHVKLEDVIFALLQRFCP